MSTLPRPLLEQQLNEIFDYIWDEENLSAHLLTMLRFRLADYALSTGHPTGFLIKSLTAPAEDALSYALRAEEMGCTHPRLNVIIGMRYYQGYEKNNKTMGDDLRKALPYFEKSVRDGCALVFDRLVAYYTIRTQTLPLRQYHLNQDKAIRYLEDVINQGCTEGKVAWRIGELYEESAGGREMAKRDAYKRALDMGTAKAALDYVRFPSQGVSQDNTKAMLLLMALLRTPGADIALIYQQFIYVLVEPSYNPPYLVTRLYKDKICMALSCCEALINMGYPEGYTLKGIIYDRLCSNKEKARKVFLEADASGLAAFASYGALGFDKEYTPQNGWQRLLYCRKGFDVGEARDKKAFLDAMIDIYKQGIPPIAKNPAKVRELEEKARCYRDD